MNSAAKLTPTNPFFALASSPGKSCRADRKEDATVLALAVRCAHTSADVWAALRFERAARLASGWLTAKHLEGYLEGPLFAQDRLGEGFVDLEALKSDAIAFLESVGVR